MDYEHKSWQWLLKNGVPRETWPTRAAEAMQRFSAAGLGQNGRRSSRIAARLARSHKRPNAGHP